MKVLALVTDAFGGQGGIAQFNRDFVSALAVADRTHEIVVLPRLGTVEAVALPDRVRQLAPRPRRLAFSLAALKVAIFERPFEVVFCGHIYLLPVATLVARILRAPLWLQAHGVEVWERPSALSRALVARVHLVTAVSRYSRSKLLAWADLAPERVRVLPNTLRPVFTPGAPDPATLAKFGLVGRKIILTVARISRTEAYKGHDRVIRAMLRIRETEPNAVYAIVGDGDGRPDLEALAERLGVSTVVLFLGQLGEPEVIALYRASTVFAMPSTGEGFGIAFLEAAACGLATIAGDRDGSVDALAHGELGRLIDPLSEPQLIDALREALRTRPTPDAKALSRFTFPHFAGHVDALARTNVR
jgi:phosphatidyl-myo-inositol dimannoside synthase